MMTTMVTLIQKAERETADSRPATGRFVPHHNRWRAAAGRLVQRMARRGFPSRARMSSVSVPGVDFRSGRSSSV